MIGEKCKTQISLLGCMRNLKLKVTQLEKFIILFSTCYFHPLYILLGFGIYPMMFSKWYKYIVLLPS